MRNTLSFLLLVPLLGLVSHLCAAGRPVLDFANAGVTPKFRFQDSGQHARPTELGGRPALEIAWDGVQQPHCEFSLVPKIALPAFVEAQLTVEVFLPANNRATLVTVRLQDKEDEVFQIRQLLPARKTGWHTVEFPVSVDNPPTVSWGGKTPNKQLDSPLRFVGMSVGYTDRENTGTIGLGAVTLDVTKGKVEPVLVTGNPLHVVKPGEENPLAIVLNNSASRETAVNLSYSISQIGAADAPLHIAQVVAIAGNDQATVNLPRPTRYGVYKIDVRFGDERGPLEQKELRYAYMPPAGPTPGRSKGFIFGISEHPQWYSQAEQELMGQAAAWAGVKVIRDGIDWRRMEPKQGEWNFDSFDRFLEVFAKHDIELAPTFPGPVPDWATAADWKPAKQVKRGRPRPDYGHWAVFVRTFVERYKGRIRFVETWNEPDLLAFANFSPEEYVKLMEIAYTETKKIDPSMVVQSGGFTAFKVSPASSSDPDFLKKAIRDGKHFYDIFAFHGHGSFPHFSPQIPRLAELRKSLGDTTPWWANETAVSAIHVGEVGQAETLFQKLLFSWANGAVGYNWYNLRNKGFDPKNNEHNFGLLTKDFQPKTAYVTYAMLARYYREAEFVAAMPLGLGRHGYLFRGKGGDYLLANWNSDNLAGDVRSFFLTGVNGQASLVDLWGNETPLAVVNGTLVLPVSRRPSTLRLSGQTGAPTIAGDLVRPQGEFTVEPGARREFVVTINNPSKGTLAVKLDFDVPQGVRVKPDHTTIRLRRGEGRDVTFTVIADATFDGRAARSVTLNLDAGGLWSGSFTYDIHTVARIPRGEFSTAPQFVLNDVSQVSSLVVNEPSTAHLFWKGVEDLGAEIRLAEKDGALRVQAIVTDDEHAQPYRGTDVWRGDNIQLALNIPGQDVYWEVGLTHLPNGDSSIYVWQTPSGRKAEDLAAAMTLKTSRDNETRRTVYEATLPLDALGLDRETARRGFGVNLLINDNDGTTRESFIAIAPGLGRSKTTEGWPIVVFEK